MANGKEAWAIFVAIGSLAMGLAIAWVLTTKLGWTEPGTALLSLLLVPLIVYMAVSGRITELSGPGGLEAKFAQFADQQAETEVEVIDESVEQMEHVVKEGMRALGPQVSNLDPKKPHNLRLQIGRVHFGRDALGMYIDQLAKGPGFKFVVLVDDAGKLIAYGPHWQVTKVLNDSQLADEFLTALNQPDVEALKQHPALHTVTLPVGTSNLDALQAMADNHLEALVVADASGRPTGVVERDQLVPKLLLALSKPR